MKPEPGSDMEKDLQRLNDELAEVARATARLLLKPRYDEAELAELEARRRELRDRIRKITPPPEEAITLEQRSPMMYSGHLVSGG
jgi:DNA repair ATPase RecN